MSGALSSVGNATISTISNPTIMATTFNRVDISFNRSDLSYVRIDTYNTSGSVFVKTTNFSKVNITANLRISDLSANKSYDFRIIPYNSFNLVGATNVDLSNNYTLTDISNVTAGTITTTSIQLNYNVNNNTFSNIALSRTDGVGGTYNTSILYTGNVNSYTDTGLTSDTSYNYYLTPYNASSVAGIVRSINTRTLGEVSNLTTNGQLNRSGYTSADYKVFSFVNNQAAANTSDTYSFKLTLATSRTIYFLLVAGGGGGGSGNLGGGGGGGGEMRYYSINLNPGTYDISGMVGFGGNGSPYVEHIATTGAAGGTGGYGFNGGNTTININGITYSCLGGTPGGPSTFTNAQTNGAYGGGAGISNSGQYSQTKTLLGSTGTVTTSPLGVTITRKGGDVKSLATKAILTGSGGGGGAGSSGLGFDASGTITDSTRGGDGGYGINPSIDTGYIGVNVNAYFSAGGGGCGYYDNTTYGEGGIGGNLVGGNGTKLNTVRSADAVENSGSGGGGGYQNKANGGKGGKGMVFFSFA